MKKIKFTIYIGEVAKNLLTNNEFAYVDIEGIYIPQGTESDTHHAKIESIGNLGIYICDWYDLLRFFNQPKDLLYAEIVLNISSNHKVFKGEEIINFIDNLAILPVEEIYKLRSFNI